MLSQVLLALLLLILFPQSGQNPPSDVVTDPEDLAYWYNSEAEISSYSLSQARYGEIHEGHAVLVFVTEPFSAMKNTKSDTPADDDVSVLKLNFTKKFNTGIYPYSMMTSTFFPFENGMHSLKISMSSQEWCGHTYMELRNRNKQFDLQLSSYFEGESFNGVSLKKDNLEDDIWTMIRLNPTGLPLGDMKMIPSFFSLRLMHKELKAYDCVTSQSKVNGTWTSYTINYPELERKLTIQFESQFPHRIISWNETYYSGSGYNRKLLTTSAQLIETLKTDYWRKNSNKDLHLRKELGLEK